MKARTLLIVLLTHAVIVVAGEGAAGGLPPPSDASSAPAFGFQPVENQPRVPEPMELLEQPNPNEMPRTTATPPSPARPGAYSAAPIGAPDSGLELRRRGDPTVQGRLPRVRRYGDLAGRPPAKP